jgi:predicted nucleotidyltransferase
MQARTISVGDALFGKTRRAVLALLFGHPDRAFYTRELIAHADAGTSQVQSELERLTGSGLVVRERRGNQVHYRANRDAAVYRELVALVTKTFGVADVLRRALRPHAGDIDVALVYGSIAQGEPTATSDVDVLLVTSLLLSDLSGALADAETALGRKVNVTLLDVDDFRRRVRAGDHFLTSVLAGPVIPLIGDAASPAVKRARRTRSAA